MIFLQEDAIIVIPYYKASINELEKVSIMQALKTLKHYRKAFLVPNSFSVKIIPFDSTCEIKKYPDKCFSSTVQYSRLMLSPDFYKEFRVYKYMLIYQLDAFVFSDNLKYFCQLGYDYIGAPWFRSSGAFGFVKGHVGNGGLSLRHIVNTIRVLETNMDLLSNERLFNLTNIGEDMVLSYLGNNPNYDYKIAPLGVAKDFSLECDFQKAYSQLDTTLPFGCHHWWNGDFEIWRQYVLAQGYDIESDYPYAVKGYSRKARINAIVKYLLKRICKYGNKNEIRDTIIKYLMSNKTVIVYGAGVEGRRCVKLLKTFNIDVLFFLDKKEIIQIDGVRVVRPDKDMLRNSDHPIIITPKIDYDEIALYLKKMGLRENVHFFYFLSLGRYIVCNHYGIKDIVK